MMREANPEDRDRMEDFLARYAETSMFLRSNLASHGIGHSVHPHSTRFFLSETAQGIGAVFGLTRGGFLMAQSPNVPDATYRAFANAIAGAMIRGMTGVSDQVTATLKALGLAGRPFSRDSLDPLYQFDIDALPDPHLSLRVPTKDDVTLFSGWYADYEMETGISSSRIGAEKNAAENALIATGPGSTETTSAVTPKSCNFSSSKRDMASRDSSE